MVDPLDPANITTFLAVRGWPGAHDIEPIVHGEWSRAFGFRAR